MDGANAAFIAKKEKWLENHLIVYNVKYNKGDNPFNQGLGTVNDELPVYEFDLRKIGGIVMGRGQGTEYSLKLMDEFLTARDARTKSKHTHAINAYFLPWGTNATFCGRLGSQADFFFTPTLNGCTFVYTGNPAAPKVAHSNFVNATTQLVDQSLVDADIFAKFGGMMPNTRLIKSDYKRQAIGEEDYRSTVIGIRRGSGWRFFYQNYMTESHGGGQLTNTGLAMCTEI